MIADLLLLPFCQVVSKGGQQAGDGACLAQGCEVRSASGEEPSCDVKENCVSAGVCNSWSVWNLNIGCKLLCTGVSQFPTPTPSCSA